MVGAALALSSVAYLSAETVMDRLDSIAGVAQGNPEGKLTGFRQSLGMIADFPLVGIGRGAFPTTSGHYLTFDPQTAEYVENEALQLPLNLGVPLGMFVVLSIALALFRALLKPGDSPTTAGLAAGLFGLALQNLADFSLELPGVAVPATIAAALLFAGDSAESHGDARPRARLSSRAALLAGLAAVAVVGVFALLDARHDWRDETDAFALSTGSMPAKEAAELAVPLLTRHPMSFVVPFAVAQRYVAELEPGLALLWINKAMYLKPTFATSHAIASQALAELGHKSQALLEARLFMENGGGDGALKVMARRYPALSNLLDAGPDTAAGRLALGWFLASAKRAADAREAGRLAVELAPSDPAVRSGRARLLLTLGDAAGAATEAQASLELEPGNPVSASILAEAEEQLGHGDLARGALEAALKHHPGDYQLTLALVRLELRQNKAADALERLKLLGPASGSAQRAEVFVLSAQVYLALGQTLRAEDAYRNAAQLQPGGGYEIALASVLESEGRFDEAARMLRELEVRMDPAQRGQVTKRIEDNQRKAASMSALGKRELLLGPH